MAGEHLDAVRQLEQPPQGVEEPLGAFDRADGEVGPGRVADEERVAREDEPRLVGPRRVDDGEAAVLGPMPGVWITRSVTVPTASSSPSSSTSCGYSAPAAAWMLTRDAVLEGEAPVPRDMVGVGVRLERAHDPDVEPLGLRERPLDRERRVDDERLARLLAPDEVRRAAEVVVQQLREQHGARR